MSLKDKIGKKQVICAVGGVCLYLVMELAAPYEGALFEGHLIGRNSYGQGDASYELMVEGLDEQEIPVRIDVGERQYTSAEAEKVFGEIMEGLADRIRGENPSLNEVRSDLNLITRLDPYGIRLQWESEDNQLLDTFGGVFNQDVPEKGKEVYLHVRMSDGTHEGNYQIRANVMPPVLTKGEKAAEGFLQEVARLDQQQRTQARLELPAKYDGRKLHYREEDTSDYKILLVLGVLLAVVCYAKDQSEERERQKARSRQMMLDYSEIVSKFLVFLGAGMTIPSAWERIVKDYEKRRQEEKRQIRYAYEEMCQTYYQLQSGMAEGQAYAEFGRRCRLRPYLKLCSLFEQNRMTGTKNLKGLLQMEMADAFEQRKNLAKRMGEEASTKLLVPLFLMLGIVMVMIIVPAFLSFY